MLQPKRIKHRKVHRGRRKGSSHTGNTLAFGEFGIQALEGAWITARQIEAVRRAIVHNMRRGGKVWIRVFPDKPATKKPGETRMGSGKGDPDHWVAVVRAERIMFEVGGVGEELAKESIKLGAQKLPIKTRFISRDMEGD